MTATRISNWAQFLVETLDKEGPQPVDEVIDRASRYVPPGRAMRRFTKPSRRLQGIRVTPTHRKIASGSRWLVMDTIRSMTVRGSLMVFENNGQRYLTLTDLGTERYLYRREHRTRRDHG